MKSRLAFLLLALQAPPAPAEPASDPWTKVPALPTSCYTKGDTFDQRANDATDALNKAEAQQIEINQDIELQSGEVDVMELQQRMMQFMSEHPEQAQRVIEAITQGGQQTQEQSPEMQQRGQQLDNELQELTAAYEAALKQAMKSTSEKRQALNTALQKSCNQDLLARGVAISAEENRAYGELCANWWKTGQFHDWFARYKQFKIEDAAFWAEHAETIKLTLEMKGVSADQYRSTDDLKAPVDYLRRAVRIFDKRRFAPVSEEPGSCEIGHG